MGPGQFSPGEWVEQAPPIGVQTASMGPGQFSPGEPARPIGSPCRSVMLQWGRGNLAPERSCSTGGPRMATWQASMGPGQFSPGEVVSQCSRRAALRLLQWGRGNLAPER